MTYNRVMSDDARREPDGDEEGSDADREDAPGPPGRDDAPELTPEEEIRVEELRNRRDFGPEDAFTDEERAELAELTGRADPTDGDVAGDDADANTGADPDPDADVDADTDAESVEDGPESDDDAPSVDGSLPDWVQDDSIPELETYAEKREAETPEREDREDPDAEEDLDPSLADQGIDWDAEDGGDEARAQSDGGATVPDAETNVVGQGYSSEVSDDYRGDFDDDDFGGLEGPEGDQEMPLADHIEEMVRRLGIVIIAMSVVSVLVLPFSVDLINFIWYSILGNVQDVPNAPHVYRPLALVLARLKVATLAGFVVALPVFVFQTYLFMRPGLYSHERRYYLAAVPTSLVLAFIGVGFAFYLVLPALFSYFVSYTTGAAAIAFGLTDTFGLMLLMMGFFAAVFQIPLLIMLAVMMGLTTRRWLVQRRLYFWGGFLGVALLFSPDPTGMAPIIVALTMVMLFEGTLLLLRWTGR